MAEGRPSAGSIDAAAARMRNTVLETFRDLESKKKARDVAQAELEETERLLQDETVAFRAVRRKLLLAARNHHDVELEIYKMEDQDEERVRTARRLEEESAALKEMAEKAEAAHSAAVDELYCPHQVKKEMFMSHLQRRIGHRRKIAQRRKRKLEILESETNKLKQQEKSVKGEIARLKETIRSGETETQDKDEEVTSLSLQIKATLTKRTSLRAAVKEAKKKQKEADKEMLKWENECTR